MNILHVHAGLMGEVDNVGLQHQTADKNDLVVVADLCDTVDSLLSQAWKLEDSVCCDNADITPHSVQGRLNGIIYHWREVLKALEYIIGSGKQQDQ